MDDVVIDEADASKADASKAGASKAGASKAGASEPVSAFAEREPTELKRAVEAIILVSSEPVPEILLAQLIEIPVAQVAKICLELADEYLNQQRGFELAMVAGGWRYHSSSDLSVYMERYAMEGFSTKLSSAALETLSIIAYKQPISRVQASAIRGVNVDGVLKTLVQRGYVEENGVDDGPGQAILFGTTNFFLEQIGLGSLEDLPALGEFVPSAAVLEALEETLKISDDDIEVEVEPESVVAELESSVIPGPDLPVIPGPDLPVIPGPDLPVIPGHDRESPESEPETVSSVIPARASTPDRESGSPIESEMMHESAIDLQEDSEIDLRDPVKSVDVEPAMAEVTDE